MSGPPGVVLAGGEGRRMGGPPGVVLAGGEGRRMGGDKALVRLGNVPLVRLTAERLRPQCGALAVSRHDGRLDGAGLDLPVLADGAPGRAGPLAGLLAALDWAAAAAPAADHVVTAPVDAPFLPADFVERLLAARARAGAAAAVASSGGRRHPVAALWPVAARAALREALGRDGSRRVGLFLDGLRPAVAEWATEPFDPFLNINAPEDLLRAEAARAMGSGEAGGAGPCKSPT